ncbi:zinc finger MYND domain-containing protein 11 [Ischnura elegans]|uniref:zinc finger MYND domain-containing protein 11 n=1 Tax=Ischnura elegans TaxID=197161 RepID=UPI001ED879FB|nr:zinc finger MYND domain-containing protein 11 [Ischnura elegans]
MNKRIFLAMSRRRVSCPQITQQLWDAIKITSYQKQLPTVERIGRYMSRVHGINEDEVKRQLMYCVRDGLIRLSKQIGCKGSKIGVPQEGYRLPKDKIERDKHDWYCFECHRGGDVICCIGCHRVYHVSCVSKEDLPEDDVKNKFLCGVCKACAAERESLKIKRKELNHLLGFTCVRLKERLPTKVTERQIPSKTSYCVDHATSLSPASSIKKGVLVGSPIGGNAGRDGMLKWVIDEDNGLWRMEHLLYHPMDLPTMSVKAANCKYRTLEEFRADAQLIVHNVVIYHGVHSSLADQARQMLRDCVYDLGEIRRCKDCYRMSNEKADKHWFCKPCRPPHDLVYAKQKGFPYWPAKVIKVEGEHYDVRFFGSQHQRANIEKSHIRPITVNIHTLQVKRTSSWTKACEELRKHQEMLEKGVEITDSSDEEDEESEEEEVEQGRGKENEGSRENGAVKEEDEDEEEEEEEEEEEQEVVEESESEAQEESEPEVKKPKGRRGRVGGKKRERSTGKKKKRRRGRQPKARVVPETEEEEDEEEEEGEEERVEGAGEGGRTVKVRENSEGEASQDEESSISSTCRSGKSVKKEGPAPEDMVSSSCQEPSTRSISIQTPPRMMGKQDAAEGSSKSRKSSKDSERALKELAERLKREFEVEKQRAIAAALRSLEHDIEKLKEDQAAEIEELNERHRQNLSDAKKKQWCYNCEAEAIYHCCWNTAYCSIDCQQVHWQKEHKRLCRRKR